MKYTFAILENGTITDNKETFEFTKDMENVTKYGNLKQLIYLYLVIFHDDTGLEKIVYELLRSGLIDKGMLEQAHSSTGCPKTHTFLHTFLDKKNQ